MTISEKRSKVCKLGNKLYAEIGDRSVAFAKAWEIVKAGEVEVAVRGVSYGTRQEALRRLASYNPADIRVFVVSEPENEYDTNALAVMVMVQGGKGIYKLGYVPREMTGAVRVIGSRPAIRIVGGIDLSGARLSLKI